MAATGYNVLTTADTISFRDGTTGLASISFDHATETLSISQQGTGAVSFGDTASDLYIGDGVNSVDLIFEVDGAVKGDTDVTLTLGATDSDILIASPVATLTGSQIATESWVLGQVVDSAPATLNTLNELAAALGDDANYSTTISTALGNRLRVDTASQGLSSTEQGYGRTNLGLGTAATYASTAFATSTHNHSLDSLSNTTITSNTSGEILKWNGAAWINNTLAEAGIAAASHTHTFASLTSKPTTLAGYGITDAASSTHNHTLDSLSNTTITSNTSGEILKWSGTAWINNTLAEAGIAAASHTHTFASLTSKPTTLAGYGITDAASSTHNHTLDSLSNTTITSNTSGEILKWSGTAWINNTLAEAGIASSSSLTSHTGNTSNPHSVTKAQVGLSNVANTLITVTSSSVSDGTNTFNKYSLPLSASGTRGGVQIGYAENGKNYPVELSSEKMFVNVPWTDTVYSLPLAASGTRGGVQIGYIENGKNYPVELSSEKMFVNVPWTDNNTTYSTATSSTLGLVKIGYTTSSQNYAVQLSNEQMFVNVPWTDNNTTYTAGNGIGLSGTTFSVAAGGGLTQDASGLSHSDTSSQASVNNTGGTVIQDITLDGYGHITALSSQDLDGRYYTESEVNTLITRGYANGQAQEASSLTSGAWYTIAQNTGDRAIARFGLRDSNSGDHQSVIFYAAHHYGTDQSSTITVLHNSSYSGTPFRYIRIKDYGTYDGAVLQVYLDGDYGGGAIQVYLLGDNFQGAGWELVDWLDDATAPSLVSNYSSFTMSSQIDLDQITQGGIATTGPIYGDGDSTQYRMFNDNYHPNADKLTTARNIALTGAVTGNTNFDGSGNISIATTATADPTLTLAGDASGSATFTNLGNATLTVTVADDSHNHVISNVDGLQTALDAKQAAGTYNTIIGTDTDISYSGATVLSAMTMTDGVIQSHSSRTLTLADLGYTGATNANNYSLPEATSTVRGGIELFSDTDQAVAANAVSSTAGRTYGIQLNSSGQAVVNVPWVDTNTTYTLASFGVSASSTELNTLDGITATTTELNYTDGVTSNIQTQLDGKAASSHTHTFASLTSKPTTLSGYGITDAASSSHNHTLDSLSNTTITSNTSGEILRWNGAAWANATLAEAGIQAAGTYNTIIGTDSDINTSGSTIIDNIYVTDGVITSMGTRTLTASDISALTQSDFEDLLWQNSGRIFTPQATPLFYNSSGTAGTLAAVCFSRTETTSTANAWAQACLHRTFTNETSWSGGGIEFSRKLGASFKCAFVASGTTAQSIRYMFGGRANSVQAAGSNPLAGAGFGAEFRSRTGTTIEWRAIAHNGTTFTASSWTDIPSNTTGNYLKELYIYSNGAGTITVGLDDRGGDGSSWTTKTTTGGPTSNGNSTYPYLVHEVVNAASGSSYARARVYDYKVFSE